MQSDSGGAKPAAVALPSLETADEAVLIDDDAVAGMEAVGARSGRDVVAKVWKLFLAQSPDAVARLEALVGQKDLPGLARQAHFLKSMSLSAGAVRLAVLCETIEHQGKAGNTAAFGRVPAAASVARATHSAMSDRLAGRLAAVAG